MLEFAIGNVGGRNCLLKSARGNILFFNKRHSVIYRHEFEDLGQEFLVETFDIKQLRIMIHTFPIVNFRELIKMTDYAVARIDLSYEDLFQSNMQTKTIYASWFARPNSIQHAPKWAIDRYHSSERR